MIGQEIDMLKVIVQFGVNVPASYVILTGVVFLIYKLIRFNIKSGRRRNKGN